MAGTDGPEKARGHKIPVNGWKFRFDSPPPGGVPGGARGGDILELFRAWDRSARGERREGARYQPFETRAYLGWWKGSRFLVTHAALINLSTGGALVQIDRRPPTSQPVWMCLGAPHPVHQVLARALEISAATDGGQRVRLRFHTPCPVSFFHAAGRRGGPPHLTLPPPPPPPPPAA